MKVVTKPVVVDAIKWQPCPGNCTPHVDKLGVLHTITECGIQLRGGFQKLKPGDWIITGPTGDKRVLDDVTFHATYDVLRPQPVERAACQKQLMK